MLKPWTQDHIAELQGRLPGDALAPATPRDLDEPRGKWPGRSEWVARPRDVGQVSALLAYANDRRLPVLPRAGGTGLVGGNVSGDDPLPLILSVERLADIRLGDPRENALIAGAGAVLADVQAAAAKTDRLFPLSLASQGSARIGGLLGTNAGGVGVLRYGNARALTLGVEAVMADGSVMRGPKRLRKDNSGYDLRDLLIGSEGTLGVITAASLRLFPRPAQQCAALFVVENPAVALALLGLAQSRAGPALSAFELIDGQGLAFLDETGLAATLPIPGPPRWSVLLELDGWGGADARDATEALFAAAQADGLASDGVVAASEAQRAALWSLREAIPEANRRVGAISSHDVSLPLAAVPEFLTRAGAEVRAMADVRINAFGHLGDGNIHFNIFPRHGADRSGYRALAAPLTDLVHGLVDTLGGSISAEHGIGRAKVADLERFADPVRLSAMRAIKAALDPHGILNPGAVLRQTAG